MVTIKNLRPDVHPARRVIEAIGLYTEFPR